MSQIAFEGAAATDLATRLGITRHEFRQFCAAALMAHTQDPCVGFDMAVDHA